jgi:type IV pilus assembly protein PilP
VARPSAEAAKVAAPPPQAPVLVYDPTGLRDPFEPFIKIEEKKPRAPKAFVAKTPLQRYAMEELKLVAIIWGEGLHARALVEDPQGKGYVVTTGTHVGDRGGKVVRIQPDRVVVEERFTDLLGEEKVNVANMTLHRAESGVKP